MLEAITRAGGLHAVGLGATAEEPRDGVHNLRSVILPRLAAPALVIALSCPVEPQGCVGGHE